MRDSKKEVYNISKSRKKVNKSKDKQVFKRTAAATRKINLSPSSMRGGIRL